MLSLFKTLLFVGAAASVPLDATVQDDGTGDNGGNTQPKCSTTSFDISEWTIHDFDFHAAYLFTTPAHQVSSGHVNFTIGNEAVDYRPVCTASSTRLQDFFYGEINYQCEGFPRGDNATFSFSRPDNNLQVNQTWQCDDNGARFIASGGANLDLSCNETNWKNPNWTMGETYSSREITCKHLTVPVPIENIMATL